MSEIRDCPECEQGKHQNCTGEVIDDDRDDDWWWPCPCVERKHKKKEEKQ